MQSSTDEEKETLITQGAEALVYKSLVLPGLPALRKHRPSKSYRHPDLDKKLTKHRILAEARLLQRCRKCGVSVPALYFLDEVKGDLWMEFINGRTIRDIVASYELQGSADSDLSKVMETIGRALYRMHDANVIHGDLTTSNLMLRHEHEVKTETSIVIIDLGLGSVSITDEDKAVDLYVLERAFISTHPRSTHLFEGIIEAYRQAGGKKATTILKRLDQVKQRGRKRTMVG